MIRLALAILALAISVPAAALDLTGTWEGKFTCTSFDGVKDKFTNQDTITITQTGDILAIGDAGGGAADFKGIVVEDLAKPERGSAGMAHCGTDDDLGGPAPFDEIASLTAKTNPGKGSGKLKGTSVFSDPGFAIGTCKWKYKRVDTADPGVIACDAVVASQ